jgi:hypothetical protein
MDAAATVGKGAAAPVAGVCGMARATVIGAMPIIAIAL